MNKEDKKTQPPRLIAGVWIARLIIGGVFVVSGFAKADDLYGFIYKIEEYLEVWGWIQPRSLVLVGAMALSAMEFLLGAMLAMGCYKRTVVWLLLAMMAFMLPLSGYIYVADPVADCGCFGDFWVISNGATFLKNIAITAALIFLAKYNPEVDGLFGAYIQWLVVTVCAVYILVIGSIGYMVQPLVDFRSFPAGSKLVKEDDGGEEAEFEFVYEKDGEKKTFTTDNLPDSTWEFVDRIQISGKISDKTDFAVLDGDENVTEEVISDEGEQLLIIIPDYSRADVSCTYAINEMSDYIVSRGGSVVCLLVADSAQIAEWRDLSMADCPMLYVEPTVLKELARGVMAAVFLRDGTIVWKRALSSIDPDIFAAASAKDDVMDSLAGDGPGTARNLTLVLLAVLAVLFMLDRSGRLLDWSIKLKKRAETLK
ncbi:MAG: DoxX family protein [Paramuribaculum sp.]|nr:DoxX family protein [Paramuribaculum sp.]